MTLPVYQIVVLDRDDGSVRVVFDTTRTFDIRYSLALNDVGLIAFSISADDAFAEQFELDDIIEVYRTDPTSDNLTREESYFLRSTQRFRQNDDEIIVIGGMSLNHLLARRVIDPDDDPLEAGGYSTKGGAADVVLRDYIREQAGDLASAERQFPNLSVLPVIGNAPNAGARLRYENLLAIAKTFSERGQIDFQIRRVQANFLECFIGIIGSDKTKTTNYPAVPYVLLTPMRGNLSDPNLILDRTNEQNFLYALGQGQGENRIVLELSGEGVTDSPYNRIEFTQDVRNAEKDSPVQLLTQASQALKEKRVQREFSFKPTGVEAGNVYRVDWVLGDKVTIQWGDVTQDLRITGIDFTLTPDGEDIQVTVLPI